MLTVAADLNWTSMLYSSYSSKKGTVNDRENIPPVVSPVFLRQLGGHIGKLLGQVVSLTL